MRKTKVTVLLLLMALTVSLLAGCGGKEEEKTKDGYAKKLYLYNWTEYIPQSVMDGFEKEYGIKVVESTFTSNEEMLAKLTAGGTGQYDMTIASNYVINAMKEQDLIEPIQMDQIKNVKYLDKSTLNQPFDKNNEYTIPYMTSFTVLCGNKKKLKELGVDIKSFNDLTNPKLKNNIVLVDDIREIAAMALKVKGYSSSTTKEDEIMSILPWLKKLAKNVKVYDADAPKSVMISNDVAVGLMYSMDAAMAIEENKDLDVIYTKEPAQKCLDNFVIIKGAKHAKEARLFIDYVLRPENYKKVLDEYYGVCINNGTKKLLDDHYLTNPGANVDQKELKRAEYIDDVKDSASIYDDLYTKLKTE